MFEQSSFIIYKPRIFNRILSNLKFNCKWCKQLDRKLLILKIVLYLIILLTVIGSGYQLFKIYKTLNFITAKDLFNWVNQYTNNDLVINADQVVFDWQKIRLSFNVTNLKLESVNNNVLITAQKVTGNINLLSTIIYGRVKINNFSADNIGLTVNSIRPKEKIANLYGNIEVYINFTKIINSDVRIQAKLATNFLKINLDTMLNIQPQTVLLTYIRLQNTADNVKDIIKYLPEKFLHKKLINWLDSALLSGSIEYSDLLINPNKDKFSTNKSSLDWKVQFKNVTLQYNKDYPVVRHLSATMHINDNNLNIYMNNNSKATILNQPVRYIKATLNDITADLLKPLLIKVEIETPLIKGIEFLQRSKLYNINKKLIKWSSEGSINLSLQLLIPVNNFNDLSEEIKFSGNCQIKKATIQVNGTDLIATNVSGNVKFANEYLASDDLQANILGALVPVKWIWDQDYLFIEILDIVTAKILSNQFNKIENNDFSITLENLSLLKNNFDKIKFTNSQITKTLYFDADNIKGSLLYKDLNFGKYSLDLDELKLYIDNRSANNINIIASKFNQINFVCKNFYLNNIYLGEIAINFVKDLESLDNNVLIYLQGLNVKNKETVIEAHGDWTINDLQNSNTKISGNIISKDFGNLLKNFNFNNKIIGHGDGNIYFNLEWPEDPFDFSLQNIKGTLKLNIKSGVIIGVNPGIGRIIGLLSIESIHRRLNLDFSDLTNVGFSFDQLNGDVILENEYVNIKNIEIVGPAAKLMITGYSNLVSKQLDLSIEVTSKVGATLPLAAAIAAGNPVIGAAVWLFDRASGAKVSKFQVIKKYKVIGTWHKPEIKPI